jgi:tryptophan synthase alpha subunit
MEDLLKILAAPLTGMTVDEFNAEVKKWIDTAKHRRKVASPCCVGFSISTLSTKL